jgi:hypothetical protein
MSEDKLVKRNSNGQLMKGSVLNPQGGHVKPYTDKEKAWNQKARMMMRGLEICEQEWEEIVLAMCKCAQQGSVPAATFLRNTFLGKPKESVEIDTTKSSKGRKVMDWTKRLKINKSNEVFDATEGFNKKEDKRKANRAERRRYLSQRNRNSNKGIEQRKNVKKKV